VPRVYFHPYPFEVIQTAKQTLLIYEYDHWMRRVHTDGRALPKDPDQLWMGTSVGRWMDDHNFQVERLDSTRRPGSIASAMRTARI
jgi:hypothetical protein